MEAASPPSLVLARRMLAAGAAVVGLGVLFVGTGHPDLGGPTLMLGWVGLAAGIHRFGRSR